MTTRDEPAKRSARIVIFGASGRVGQLLVRRFNELGHPVLGVGRREQVLSDLPCDKLVLDLSGQTQTETVAQPGDIVINAAHARFTESIAGLCDPEIARLVVIGSTRYLTRYPDRKAQEVQAASTFLEKSQLSWVLLHPTMIYGAQGENNAQRMAALISRFHIIPLPKGGAALIQPVHVSDVADAVVSAATKSGIDGRTFHVGGPEAISFRSFLEAIADAAETWVKVVPFPLPLLRLLAAATRVIPGIPSVTGAEVQRLLEDKDVDISDMHNVLGVQPRSLVKGLRETFGD